MILFQKLSEIYTKPSNSNNKLKAGYNAPPISFQLEQKNKNFLKTNKRKWEIFRISKENNDLQKRLLNTASSTFFRKSSPDEKMKTGTSLPKVSTRSRSIVSKDRNKESISLMTNQVEQNEPKTLYKRLAFIDNLGLGYIEFVTDGNKYKKITLDL